MRNVKRLPLVDIELRQAADYYEAAREGTGLRFLAEVQRVTTSLTTGMVNHAVRFHDVRKVNLKKFPYALYYFIDGEEIVVIGVLHTHADTRDQLLLRRSWLKLDE